LGSDDNMVSIKDLVVHEDLAFTPHSPEKILDSRIKHLRSKPIQEFKSKWLDKSICDATWERKTVLKTNFLTLICHCKSEMF
jgi:hypothetical protein